MTASSLPAVAGGFSGRLRPIFVIPAAIMLILFITYASEMGKSNNEGTTVMEATKEQSRTPASPGVFVLLVNLEFKEKTDLQDFIQWMEPMIENARRNEIDTLTYEIAISDDNPMKVVILERFSSKEAYLKHKRSASADRLRENLAPLRDSKAVIVTGQSYTQTGKGFV
mmetsp:Transcript_20005/g.28157  ORF Transcript_20005/g.28157 Transcript_20005/m.28157 type:complete len:169 (+) Transcript_20005:138-644(+)